MIVDDGSLVVDVHTELYVLPGSPEVGSQRVPPLLREAQLAGRCPARSSPERGAMVSLPTAW